MKHRLTRMERRARVVMTARDLAVKLGGSGIIDPSVMLFPTAKHSSPEGDILYDESSFDTHSVYVSPGSGKIVGIMSGKVYPSMPTVIDAAEYFLTK